MRDSGSVTQSLSIEQIRRIKFHIYRPSRREMVHSPIRLALTPCTQEELYNPVDSTTQEYISRARGICDCARGELFSIGDVPEIN